jgi:hypothetical protein
LEKDFEMPDGVTRALGSQAHEAPVQQRVPTQHSNKVVTPGISAVGAPTGKLSSNRQRDLEKQAQAVIDEAKKNVKAETTANDKTKAEAETKAETEAKAEVPNDRLSLFYWLDDGYRNANREVRQAIRMNSEFPAIVKGAAEALLGSFLRQNRDEQALHFLRHFALKYHPDLATALVIAATPLFENKNTSKRATLKDEKVMGSRRTYLQHLEEHINSKDPEARDAIRRLRALVVVQSGAQSGAL